MAELSVAEGGVVGGGGRGEGGGEAFASATGNEAGNDRGVSLWESMIIEEKRLAAAKEGFARVSDFEEARSLHLALAESSVATSSSLLSAQEQMPDAKQESMSLIKKLPESEENEEEEEEAGPAFLLAAPEQHQYPQKQEEEGPPASIWSLLPADVCNSINRWCGQIDTIGYLNCVSKNFALKTSEYVCRLFCQATYPQQFGNKKMVVSNFGNSYLLMLIHRPRIRINGFYSVSTLYSKAPNHDNFWEEKRTMSVEVRFYRHLRFYNNGRVLYSLDIVNPWDITALLGQGRPVPKKIFEGTYAAKGREVVDSVNMAY